MDVMDYQNQVVLITGGAGGLGTELSKEFLKLGAKVYICDHNDTNLQNADQAVKEEVNDKFEYYHQTNVDVRKLECLQAWVQDVIRKEKAIHILINAAGICPVIKMPEITEQIWDDVVDVNLKTTFFASQAVMDNMIEGKYGRIINVSSIAAYTGGAIASPPYSAAKLGIVALTKSLANYLSPHGITVNAVAPGPFDTEMIADYPQDVMEKIVLSTPNRRVGQTEDVVHAILFLTERRSLHITGATLDINGGLYLR